MRANEGPSIHAPGTVVNRGAMVELARRRPCGKSSKRAAVPLALVLAIAALALPFSCSAAPGAVDGSRVSPHRAWFQPTLTTNSDPACAAALHAARQTFFSANLDYSHLSGFERLAGAFEGRGGHDPRLTFTQQDPSQFVYTIGGKSPVYGYFVEIPGCGGACETEEIAVSGQPFPPRTSFYSLTTNAATEPAAGWTLQRRRDGSIYGSGVVGDDKLQLYRLVSPSRFKLSCEIALAPKFPLTARGGRLSAASREVDALLSWAHELSGVEGNMCGSMHTLSRWRDDIKHGLQQTLWRPWALAKSTGDASSENSFGDYARISRQFALWSLGGLDAWGDYQQYQAQLTKTTRALAAFYAAQYGWPRGRALKLADAATKNAIANGFGFYLYDPYPYAPEIRLRTAILAHRPLPVIRAIDFDPKALSTYDSILDIAVSYPEALAYLLKRGINPNAANAFGKTPLMYAAQQNQLAAVRLLLAAGANPNAATVQPSDTCTYPLLTAHVTALHYAARYASLPVIAQLVRHGAATAAQAQTGAADMTGLIYPLDWLHRYAAPGAGVGRNPNLGAAEVKEAERLLAVPDAAARAHLAANAVAHAEAAYGKGDAETAYRLLEGALAVQPDNQKALSDLPLVALRAGHTGPALRAASQARRALKNPAQQAAAWFNLGLICERADVRNQRYDSYGCDEDSIQPFIHAWQTAPTPARANKLRSLFVQGAGDVCVFTSFFSGEQRMRLVAYRDWQRLYILHPARQDVDPAQFRWTVQFGNKPVPTVLTPQKMGETVLGDDAITELQLNNYGKHPVVDGKPWCKQ